MDDKKQPPKGQPATTQKPAAPRHRFAEGETAIMPLADILRSRDAKALSDPGLSGTVPAEWGRARDDLAAALQAAVDRELSEAQDETQIVSAFGGLRTEAPGTPLGEDTRPADRAKQAAPKGSTEATARAAAEASRSRADVPPADRAPTAPAAKLSGSPPPDLAAAANSPVSYATEGMGRGKGGAKVRNQVIVFFSCKGGAGATALAVNAAHTFARDRLSTCLVDMDLQLGDALAALALKPKMTLAQAAAGAAAGDKMPRDRLPLHHSGVAVLSQVGSLEDLDTVSSENMARLVDSLRESFDVIVLDGVREFSDNVLAVLDVADKICIVTVQEVLSVRRARWSFNILRKIGFDPKDITVVINRFDARSEVPLASVKAMFDPATVMSVVSDPLPVLQSLNRGVPLQETSANRPVTRQISRLANSLVGNAVAEDVAAVQPAATSILGRLFRKSK